jgi:hypothetical protein
MYHLPSPYPSTSPSVHKIPQYPARNSLSRINALALIENKIKTVAARDPRSEIPDMDRRQAYEYIQLMG